MDYVLMSDIRYTDEQSAQIRQAKIFFEMTFSSEAEAHVTREMYYNAPDYAIPLMQWDGQAWTIHSYRAKKGGYVKQVEKAKAFLKAIGQPVA